MGQPRPCDNNRKQDAARGAVLACLIALGGTGWQTLKPCCHISFAGAQEALARQSKWQEASIVRGLWHRQTQQTGDRSFASLLQRVVFPLWTQLLGINMKGIFYAYIFFLRDKLCCFRLPWFPVSLVTLWYGVGDEGDGGREGGARKWWKPIAKIVNRADDVGRLFSPGKRTKRQSGCFLAKMVAVFYTLQCFIIQKGEKTVQQN